ncbi:MAG: hypothetical protein JWQ45_2898 [Blastococcus sp.]|nr:hypothetical protein [Blastococcus sp.]
MTSSGRRGLVVLGVGAFVQLAVWIALRPDLAGPRWTEGTAAAAWLALEAVAAVLIGVTAPERAVAVRTVVAGWALQALHFTFLGDHYDDTLWGVGVLGQLVLAAAAVVLALLGRLALRRPQV